MFVSRGHDEVRTVVVTRGGLAALAAVAGVVLLFASALVFTVVRARVAPEIMAPAGAGAQLVAELNALEGKLATLDGQMSVLLKRNEELRIMADLPKIPVEVAAVGVGGPGHEETAGLLAGGPVERRLAAAESDLDVLLRRSGLVASSMRHAEQIIRGKTDRWGATPSILPTDGFLSSPFSFARKHPLLGTFRPHYGVDISARAGNKVLATADGRVTVAGWSSGSGNHVEIDHGYGIRTLYSHNAKLLVRTGELVRRGEPIGLVGSTGVSVGPHVHYEVHEQGQPVDPMKFIFPDVAAD